MTSFNHVAMLVNAEIGNPLPNKEWMGLCQQTGLFSLTILYILVQVTPLVTTYFTKKHMHTHANQWNTSFPGTPHTLSLSCVLMCSSSMR